MTDFVWTNEAASQASTKESIEKENYRQFMMTKNEVAVSEQKKLLILSQDIKIKNYYEFPNHSVLFECPPPLTI